jgi:hypothetical protein
VVVQSTGSNSETVQVILHSERQSYSVGESIRPKLELRNPGEFPIEISRGFEFDWERLIFADPNAAHLIGPDGQDKLLPYRRPASFEGLRPPIRLEARKAEWLYLPISHHLHPRELGKYGFWLELLDNLGVLHCSNQITFQIVDIEYSLAPHLVELTLESTRAVLAAGEPVLVRAVFTNKSDQPTIFLRPQEDSFDGWVNPVYQFVVFDAAGRSLAPARRCGSMATPVYDKTTKFTLEPGESGELNLQLPIFPDMRHPGEYRLSLTYIVRKQVIGKGGKVLDKWMNWEERVFLGRIESNEIVLEIE